MRKKMTMRVLVAGALTAGGVLSQVAKPSEAEASASCNGGIDCADWNANGCRDAYYIAIANGTDDGFFGASAYIPNFGYVSGYYCYKARSIAGETLYDDSTTDGSNFRAKTYWKGCSTSNTPRSDTHTLNLSSFTGTSRWTKQLDDADLYGWGMGWSGTAWYATLCY
jgi:hypothetical protein